MFTSALLLVFQCSFVFAAAANDSVAPCSSATLSPPAVRLTSNAEHKQFLLEVLAKARQSVLISSHVYAYDWCVESGIQTAIQSAVRRRVKVYIYYKKGPEEGDDDDKSANGTDTKACHFPKKALGFS